MSEPENNLNNKETPQERSVRLWGRPENDGTLIEKDGFFYINKDIFYDISRSLEKYHAVFYKFWELGHPVFSHDALTAQVEFNSEGDCVAFKFNPYFWLSMDEYSRKFVICHEMLHVILNHGARARNAHPLNRAAINTCLDIVVNSILLSKFHFNKEKVICGSEKKNFDMILVDNVFSESPSSDLVKTCDPSTNKVYAKSMPPSNKMFEFYYNLLPKNPNPLMGSFGTGSLINSHDHLSDPELAEAIGKLNDALTPEQKKSIKKMIEENYQKDNSGEEVDGDKADAKSGKKKKKEKGKRSNGNPESQSNSAGDEVGYGYWDFSDINRPPPKKKWESVIRNWMKSRITTTFDDVEQWSRRTPRQMFLPRTMLMPFEYPMERIKKEKKKIQLWFFMDASGSCAGYHERFVQAARSVPCSPRDPFEVRLFSFDVRCYELAEAEIKGGGGTSFVCIEKYIREKMSEESIHYPESVWVLTDGMGDNVQPAIPENWHFFLTMQYTSCIPSQSHRHMLDNYE